ncbi:MAG: hypothetical protein PGN15_15170 [Aeromicrobium erythreum]
MLADKSQETGGLRRGRGRATTAEHDDGARGGPQHRDPRSTTQWTHRAPRRLAELSTSRRIPHRRVEGSEPLRDHPFGALLISGLLESATLAGPNPLRAAVEAVRRRLPSTGPAALLVDDADHLDAQSVAVLRHLERRGLVVAAAYRTDLAGSAAPRVLSGAPVVVDAPSLAPTALLATLRERLGGGVSARLLSEVFALSGGVVGIAEHLVDDGVFDGSITQVDGAWDLRATLVSRSLDGLWQAYLRELPPSTASG